MSAFETTTPDNISKLTSAGPASLVQTSQTMGDSIQVAFNKRQRYDYVWDDSSDRDAQTGMVQGSRGYQVDTKTEYIYDDSTWRIALPYAEFGSSSVTVPPGTYTGFGNIDIDTDMSTSTTFATAASSNYITIVEPGIYALSVFAVASSAMSSGIAFTMVGTDTDATFDFAYQIARGTYATDNVSMTSLPFYRIASANQRLYFYHRQNTGSNRDISARIRLGRLG